MALSHMNPMVDIGMLLAQHGVMITIVTSSYNAVRFEKILTRATESGLPIQVVKLPVPYIEVGLPEGSENLDMLPCLDLLLKFIKAIDMLIASKYQIPRISFHGFCYFCLVCLRKIHDSVE
ncbi:hypothetical protein SLEP1_g39254 [Rubroshorea leprosula]|uniref:Uncharacterized protein n=1 Tax=Rubroshorea leprosula TaxID=152421 RepID=A0AAV5L0F1_9ROSI|nr:hypothetical protein SLEP1_g39254 [Rubroshorea leprosula]